MSLEEYTLSYRTSEFLESFMAYPLEVSIRRVSREESREWREISKGVTELSKLGYVKERKLSPYL